MRAKPFNGDQLRYSIVCTKCGRGQGDLAFRCSSCNSILEVRYDYSGLRVPKGFRSMRVSNSKYVPFFPVSGLMRRGGEGGTPLERRRFGSIDVLMKLETENPTRSFKDRGSAVEIAKAIELEVGDVCCASTGNMGISIARYSLLAGMRCTIFIGKGASARKKARIKGYGSRIVEVDGDFNTSLRMAERFSRKTGAMLCGDYHYRKEGQKSVVLEIIEQMKYDVPDFIFLPVGNATLLSGMYKGLREFRMASLIRRFPRLVAVQSEGCAPLIRAYNSGRRLAYVKPRTIADAIEVGYPTFGAEGIKALKGTRGVGVAVSDAELRIAMRRLKEMGIGAEAGGAAGFAGFAKLYADRGRIFRGKKVAVVVSGNN